MRIIQAKILILKKVINYLTADRNYKIK